MESRGIETLTKSGVFCGNEPQMPADTGVAGGGLFGELVSVSARNRANPMLSPQLLRGNLRRKGWAR